MCKLDMSLRSSEKCWKFVTKITIICCGLGILFWMVCVLISLQGMLLSKEIFARDEKEMKFARVAAAAKHMCDNRKSNFVTVHCGSVLDAVGLFNETKHDPVRIAATAAYLSMQVQNDTATAQLLQNFVSLHQWVEYQRFLLSVHDYLAGPVVFLFLLFVMLVLFIAPVCIVCRRLNVAVHTRQEAMEQHNRPMEAVIQQQHQRQEQEKDTRPRFINTTNTLYCPQEVNMFTSPPTTMPTTQTQPLREASVSSSFAVYTMQTTSVPTRVQSTQQQYNPPIQTQQQQPYGVFSGHTTATSNIPTQRKGFVL